MQQEFEPKLPRDILKMSRNKSFYFRARFGAIYNTSKTKKYLLKNSMIGNRLLFRNYQTLNSNLLVPKIQTGVFFYLIVININFLKFQNNFTTEF